jgi:hypothetical protein
MSIARAAAALLAALSLAACAPDSLVRTELTAAETLELLALTERIEAELDERDALAAHDAAGRAPAIHASLGFAAALRLHR